MQTARSASRTASESRSASEYTWTVSMPASRQLRLMRTAISPRLAMRTRRIGLPISRLLVPTFELEINDLRAGLVDDDRIEIERHDAGVLNGQYGYLRHELRERGDGELRPP